MATETVSIRLTGEGFDRVGGQFDKLGRKIGDTDKRTKRMNRSMGIGLRRSVHATRGLIAAVGGVGAVMGTRAILNYQKELARLRIDGKLTANQFGKLQQAITDVASVGIQNDEAAAGLRIWQDFGSQVMVGARMLKFIGQVSQSTGTDFAAMNQLVATLTKNMGLTEDQAITALATLKKLGDAGNISLSTSAMQLPRILSSGRAEKFGGQRGVRQLFGAFQLIAGSFGSGPDAASRGATALEAILAGLVGKAGKIKKDLKIDVFSKEDRSALRDIDEVLGEIIKKAEGKPALLFEIFGREGKRGLNAFVDPKTGKANPRAKEMLSGISGTRADLEADYSQYRNLAKEAHQVEVALANMREKLTTAGLQIGSFVSQNPFQSAALVLGAKASGLADILGQTGARAGGMLALSIAAGTAADRLFGLSDSMAWLLSNWTDNGDRKRQQRKVIEQSTKGMKGRNLVAFANQLVGHGRGKEMETSKGKFEKLTPEVAMRLIEKMANQTGSQEDMKEQMRLLTRIVAALENKPNGNNVDNAATQGGRGSGG